MTTWLKFLVCLLMVRLACSHHMRGSIVCYLRLHADLDESLRPYLRQCNYVVVCDDHCDRRSKPFLPCAGDKLSHLKQLAPHAKIVLSISLSVNPFELRVDESRDQFCRDVERCVGDGLYDGIDLDFNAFMLEFSDQIIFGQFLEKLRQRLGSKNIISISLDAQRFAPGSLSNSIRENVDFIVTSRDQSFSNVDQNEEFYVRKYSDAVIDRLLVDGFPPEKIVLGLQTAGIVANPSEELDTDFKKCTIIGLIPYSQICELHDQCMRFCSWRSDRRCLLFDGRSKAIYDNLDSAKERALQCTTCKVKGVSILLDFDDRTGTCGGVRYPLLGAIVEIFSDQEDFVAVENKEVKSENEVSPGRDHLNAEIDRLELAIEGLEKSTNILQKIANLLLRALYKLIDLVLSFVTKQNVEDPGAAEQASAVDNPALDEDNEDIDDGASIDDIAKEVAELIEDENRNMQVNKEEAKQVVKEEVMKAAELDEDQKKAAKENIDTEPLIPNFKSIGSLIK